MQSSQSSTLPLLDLIYQLLWGSPVSPRTPHSPIGRAGGNNKEDGTESLQETFRRELRIEGDYTSPFQPVDDLGDRSTRLKTAADSTSATYLPSQAAVAAASPRLVPQLAQVSALHRGSPPRPS